MSTISIIFRKQKGNHPNNRATSLPKNRATKKKKKSIKCYTNAKQATNITEYRLPITKTQQQQQQCQHQHQQP